MASSSFHYTFVFVRSCAAHKLRATQSDDVHEVPFGQLLEPNEIDRHAEVSRLLGQNLLAYWAFVGAGRHDLPSFGLIVAFLCVDSAVLTCLRRNLQSLMPESDPVGRGKANNIWETKFVYAIPAASQSLTDTMTWLFQTVLFVLLKTKITMTN